MKLNSSKLPASIVKKRSTRRFVSKYKQYVKHCSQSNKPVHKSLIKKRCIWGSTKQAFRTKLDIKIPRFIIEAPEKLDLYAPKNIRKTLSFVKKLKAHLPKKNERIEICFKHTSLASATATLLCYSVIEQAMINRGSVNRPKINLPRNAKIRQVLSHVGFHKALGSTDIVEIKDPSVKFWQYENGCIFQGQKLSHFLDKIVQHLNIDLYPNGLYEGLKEAIGNVIDHAYDSDEFQLRQHAAELNKWWIYGGVKDAGSTIVLLVCDLGMGIPNSLKQKHANFIKQFFENTKNTLIADTTMIVAATELGRSKTKEQGRGHGLHELRHIATSVAGAALNIVSSRGQVEIRNGKIVSAKDLKNSIEGTLIELSLPVKALTAA